MADHEQDFWNLEDFLPPKKEVRRSARAATSPEPVEIYAPPPPQKNAQASALGARTEPPSHPTGYFAKGNDSPSGEEEDVPLAERPVDPFALPVPPREAPEHTYFPKHSLLREIRVYPWQSSYMFYEQFRVHAEKLNARDGEKCQEVDFFSYMPQYTQLNREQLRYYLWWRTNFRRGICLHAAFSYLLLYLYEQINLSGVIPPATGQRNILNLWRSYRGEHPRLDVLVREWLCDYSLLHGLPPPTLPREQFGELLAGCRLKEFYVSGWRDTEDEVVAILLFCNNYDYKKSKFYREETAELYDRVLAGAVSVTLQYLRRNEEDGELRTSGVSTITREAFSGAVCSCRVKRRIEVDFCSFSHTHELRYVVTDVLKYCENAIRGALSIKPRLTVYQVSTELKQVLDAYLATALPQKAPKRGEKEAIPAYEKRYEIPVAPISPERAAQIEAASWATTKKLVEAFADSEENAEKRILSTGEPGEVENKARPEPRAPVRVLLPEKAPESASVFAPPVGSLAVALGDLAEFVRLAARGARAEQRAFAAKRGEMIDAVADRINTIAGDVLGDIILLDEGGYYTVIKDYTEDLRREQILL